MISSILVKNGTCLVRLQIMCSILIFMWAPWRPNWHSTALKGRSLVNWNLTICVWFMGLSSMFETAIEPIVFWKAIIAMEASSNYHFVDPSNTSGHNIKGAFGRKRWGKWQKGGKWSIKCNPYLDDPEFILPFYICTNKICCKSKEII